MLTRDAFTLIGLTRHAEPEYVKLEFELRNFPEQPAVALEWKGGGFEVSDNIDLAGVGGQVEDKREKRFKAMVDLLGSDGLTTSNWKQKAAKLKPQIPPATFARDKKKLIAAKQVCKDEKTKRWKKTTQSSG